MSYSKLFKFLLENIIKFFLITIYNCINHKLHFLLEITYINVINVSNYLKMH